jgi:hypothetical protein
MRVENWNPNLYDEQIFDVSAEVMDKAAQAVAREAQRLCPVGTVSRPIYKTGPFAGKAWTARDAGQLKRSIRVVRKTNKYGKAIYKKRDVRVYAGNYLAYYASIVEFNGKQFLRPAVFAAHDEMMGIVRASNTATSNVFDWKPGQQLSEHARQYHIQHGLGDTV